MSFGGFLDNSSGGGGARIVADIPYSNNMATGAIAQPRLVSPSLAKSMFSSPGLSLALQTSMEGQGEVTRLAENFESGGGRRSREDEHESRSGSDNMDGASGDDQDAADNPPRKKRYHRHTPQQIQELEALFKECPHPDEKQRLELSRRLSLETRQVKFWFQNRRTQMKTQLERHENSILRQENDKLRAENMSIRDAMRNPICTNCGGPAIIGDISLEEQHLRIENARLKDELDRVCALAGKFLGRPISSLASSMAPAMPSSSLELGVGSNGFGGLSTVATTLPLGHDFGGGISSTLPVAPPTSTTGPVAFVTESTRETGMVIINSLALVETLMDSNRWAEMFPCMIARTSTTDVISSGMGGTRNGALQLMHAELQVLSPLVPVREVNFLRFCKQHAEGVWAVVDVSIDTIRETSVAPTFVNCRRLPSGCVVQDMPNGYSKVTWVEHAEYDESAVHQLYRPLLGSGMGFGAQRWVATLQRQCECLAILMSSTVPTRDHTAITAGGRRSMLKLAQRMTDNFCAGVCASTVHKWNKLCAGNVDEDVRVMTRKSVDDPGEPPGIVLSAATSVWLPVSPQRLFDFLRDERLRSEWDILSNGGPMQEMAHIAKGQDHGNCVSLLRASVRIKGELGGGRLESGSIHKDSWEADPKDCPCFNLLLFSTPWLTQPHCAQRPLALTCRGFSPEWQFPAMNANQSSMLILQETCIDAAGSLVVYAPVDIPAMHVVMNGGDSAYVALLPSGFAIVPDGPGSRGPNSGAHTNSGGPNRVSGSLLTVAFQILVNSLPTAKLTVESVETVNNLISCTVQKIKAALHCES
ncbi:Homeobox-leucine zipper protein ROC2 [Vitis vinifera]|uniref:Homeobox-leucine zipper protein ROC2 n=1 Tax=Vitis vinifera TaxID=29760 RepID=A0A438DAV6_VITVI|nr:Homeobox-leucine zipper protein ROC2 [Vitis vinifera]